MAKSEPHFVVAIFVNSPPKRIARRSFLWFPRHCLISPVISSRLSLLKELYNTNFPRPGFFSRFLPKKILWGNFGRNFLCLRNFPNRFPPQGSLPEILSSKYVSLVFFSIMIVHNDLSKKHVREFPLVT